MQDSRSITLVAACLVIASLTACAPYRPAPGKAAMCNQLNSQMVFAGSTGNSRQADIQNAEAPMVARTYDKDNCS